MVIPQKCLSLVFKNFCYDLCGTTTEVLFFTLIHDNWQPRTSQEVELITILVYFTGMSEAMLAMCAVKNIRASGIFPTATLKLLARAYTAGGASFVSSRI